MSKDENIAMMDCECQYWARVFAKKELNQPPTHHPRCEHFKPVVEDELSPEIPVGPKVLQVFEVTDGGEIDWVVHYSEEEAIRLSKASGCCADWDPEFDEELTAKVLRADELAAITIADDEVGMTYTLQELLDADPVPGFLGSTCY